MASAGRVLMLVENFFPSDTRVRNESELLRDAGYEVNVVCLRKPGQRFREDINGIRVFRIPAITVFEKTDRHCGGRFRSMLAVVRSVVGYLSEYVYFSSACLVLTVYVMLRYGFDVLHCHNPPDTLVVVGLFGKLCRRKYVFDHHDLCPELYLSRFGVERSMVHRVLLWLERRCLRLADVVVATNESYKAIEVSRGTIRAEKVFVVRNGPNLKRLSPTPADEELTAMRKVILGYIGAINPQDGLDYLLRSLQKLVYELRCSDFFCVVIGSGDSLEEMRALTHRLGLADHVRFTGYVPDAQMLRFLSTADICLDPDPASPLNNVSTWIKIMEYMALGKPIVTFDLKETRVSAGDAALYVTPNDELAFAKAVLSLMRDSDLRTAMGAAGRRRVETALQWSVVGQNLLAAYKYLLK